MVVVVCRRCKHSWDYKGKSKYFATCPLCLIKTPIFKKKKKGRGARSPKTKIK